LNNKTLQFFLKFCFCFYFW